MGSGASCGTDLGVLLKAGGVTRCHLGTVGDEARSRVPSKLTLGFLLSLAWANTEGFSDPGEGLFREPCRWSLSSLVSMRAMSTVAMSCVSLLQSTICSKVEEDGKH